MRFQTGIGTTSERHRTEVLLGTGTENPAKTAGIRTAGTAKTAGIGTAGIRTAVEKAGIAHA